MSGGFFRGTSADQDTRFSNKQAKLLKSQKFAPELENLVDMTKVKMDVMKPWIAKRVTELIGFEDEVLINFIYGLLEGEAVNGKQIQISLTGFMERNTGKFMKELWSLLISAQQNVSGVPQQFLDAKEEETQKKKAETDRIANEILKKKEKEKQEFHDEKAKMDGDGAKSKVTHSELEPNVKHDARSSAIQKTDERERYKKRTSRYSRSPDSPHHSLSSRRKHSVSPSKSESRSYSNERRRSRSISGAPPSRSLSSSSERRDRSPPRRSMTPRRRHGGRRSPSPRHRYNIKRRSRSHSRRRSPSPARYRVRSPRHRRSRSPLRRRSRSPVHRRSRMVIRRSPIQYRSRTPVRRRSPSPILSRSPSPIRGRSPSPTHRKLQSPVRRRSPSPVRRRSPSPLRRRSPSPIRRRSPSPVRRRSPSPVRRRSPSPLRRRSLSPVRRRSPSPVRRRSRSPLWKHSPSHRNHSPSPSRRRYKRSLSISSQKSMSPARRRSSMHGSKRSLTPVSRRFPSPQESSSPTHNRRNSLSPVRRGSLKRVRSPILSPGERGERARRHEKDSPARRASPSERAEIHHGNHKGTKSAEHKPTISLRSPQRDVLDQKDVRRRKQRNLSPSMQKSPSGSDASRGRSYSEERRSISPLGSPHQRRGRIAPPDSPNSSRRTADYKTRLDNSRTSVGGENNLSSRETGDTKNRSSGKSSSMSVHDKGSLGTDDIRCLADGTKSRENQITNRDKPRDTGDTKDPRKRQELSAITKTNDTNVKSREYDDAARANKDKKIVQAEDDRDGHQFPDSESLPKLSRKLNDQNGSLNSPLKETDEPRGKVKEKRKKKSDRQDADSDDSSSYDSYDERKEAKKRRKEEKKLKKESRRRRRDEKRRRRDERRAEKLKLKSGDASSSPSDQSEEESVKRRELRASNIEEMESEQKRLEIELREKALKSLRAKKGAGI